MTLPSSCRVCHCVCQGSICDRCKTIDDNKRLARLQYNHPHNNEYDSHEYRINRQRIIEIAQSNHLPCWICHQPFVKPSDISADHFIPLSDGGTHDLDNLRPSHVLCNKRRGNKHPVIVLSTTVVSKFLPSYYSH